MLGGNVKVVFERTEGRDSIQVGVDAPRSVQVLRGQMYENEIAKLAASGDQEAGKIYRGLMADYEKRVKRYNARRNSRAEHDRRIRAGEIKTPDDWGTGGDEATERYLNRAERGRRTLSGELQPANPKDWGIQKSDWNESVNAR
jgi:sRNA-binding carbon storage regulator CsrA